MTKRIEIVDYGQDFGFGRFVVRQGTTVWHSGNKSSDVIRCLADLLELWRDAPLTVEKIKEGA